MAKQINTRILLKYDSYENWMASSFILKKGEAAICEMKNTVDQSAAPTILVKFGDGSHSFSQLPWSSALAADVYAWAKADSIQIEEVLAEGASEADGSVKVFTGVAFNKDTGKLVFTYKYAAKASDITTALSDYTTKTDVATAKQEAITAASGDATSKANAALLSANEYTDGLANGQVKTNKENIATLTTKVETLEVTGGQANVIEGVQVNGADLTPDANKKVNIDLVNATVAKAGDADKLGGVAAADYATKTVAQGYADAKDTAIAAAKKAGTDAQAYAEGVAGRVATIEGDYLKAADKTALQEQITTNANAITTLTEGLNPDKIDGVKDLVDYVNEHGTEVTGMKEDIAANSAAIALAETKEDANQKLVDAKAYTDEQVEAAKADSANGDAVVLAEAQAYAKKYADDNFLLKTEYKEYDDTALSGKVTALETAVGDENSGLVKDVADLETEVAKKLDANNWVSDSDGLTQTIDTTTEDGSADRRTIYLNSNALGLRSERQNSSNGQLATVEWVTDLDNMMTGFQAYGTAVEGEMKVRGLFIRALPSGNFVISTTNEIDSETNRPIVNNFSFADKSGTLALTSDIETAIAGLDLGDKNIIESVKVNNTALEVTDKAVNIDLTGYVLKSEATGYGDILTKTDAASTYRAKADKITSEDLSDEVWIFNCGSATEVID